MSLGSGDASQSSSKDSDFHFLKAGTSPTWYHEFYTYLYTGEEFIMRMFSPQQHKTRQITKAGSRRVGLALLDKSRLYKELGFKCNFDGTMTPVLNKKTGLIYKPRHDSNSFLSGILFQDDRSNPLVSEHIMWIDRSKGRLKPSVWMIKGYGTANQVAMHAVPNTQSAFTELRTEGQTKMSLWTAYSWRVTPTKLPESLVEALDLLSKNFQLGDCITVDCLNDRVFDVHTGLSVPDLKFDHAQALSIAFGCSKERPYFDKQITELRLNGVN